LTYLLEKQYKGGDYWVPREGGIAAKLGTTGVCFRERTERILIDFKRATKPQQTDTAENKNRLRGGVDWGPKCSGKGENEYKGETNPVKRLKIPREGKEMGVSRKHKVNRAGLFV